MAAGVEYTIDELAREAGTTVRSVRVYHERGVLPPPQVKGRTGFYGEDHLNRVRTISRLLNRGIKINGIRELLEAWDRGEDLGSVLGVESAPTPAQGAPELFSATELADRVRGVPSGLARVVAAGIYEPVDATTYRVHNDLLHRVTERLTGAGLSMSEVLDEIDQLRSDCERIARRHVALFHRAVSQVGVDADDSLANLTELLTAARLVPGRLTSELVTQYASRYLETEISELTSRRSAE